VTVDVGIEVGVMLHGGWQGGICNVVKQDDSRGRGLGGGSKITLLIYIVPCIVENKGLGAI
jgi:hypothetical protein